MVLDWKLLRLRGTCQIRKPHSSKKSALLSVAVSKNDCQPKIPSSNRIAGRRGLPHSRPSLDRCLHFARRRYRFARWRDDEEHPLWWPSSVVWGCVAMSCHASNVLCLRLSTSGGAIEAQAICDRIAHDQSAPFAPDPTCPPYRTKGFAKLSS